MVAKNWTAGTGIWGNGQNWSPIGFAGAADDVTIAGPASITGNGYANSITALGTVNLSGIFASGTLTIGSAAASGVLTLASGSLAAVSGTILFGPISVTGSGTKLSIYNQLTLGGPRSSTSLMANTLLVSGGGTAQLGSVVMVATQGGNGLTVADSASKIEVGAIGGAAAGTITVDANRSIIGQGTLSAAKGVVNAGTITAQGGVLGIGGGVSGAGSLQIGAGATLYLMTGQTSQDVTFSGAGGQLEIVPTDTGGLTETGAVNGFMPGDTILYAGSSIVSSVSYQSTGTTTGTLTLSSGASVLGTLKLVGNYNGYVFQVTPNANYGTLISVVAPTGGGTAGGGSPGTDGFAWIGSSGFWASAANWQDTTTHVNGVAVPGSANVVTLNGSSGTPLTITGPGSASALSVTGNALLSGVFTAGTVSVGTASASGSLALAPGGKLTATSGSVLCGPLQASGSGTKLAITGALTLGGARTGTASSLVADALSVTSGAAATVGQLIMAASPGGNSVTVDTSSTLEIGTAGNPLTGSLTVDPGASLQGSGLVVVAGGVLNQGTITAAGGMLQIGAAVAGSGGLAIGNGATLSIYNGSSSQPVSFTGSSGTLQVTLTATGALTETGVISGFAAGDNILFASSVPVTAATYTAGAHGTGTLTLMNGAIAIGTLGLSGDYSYESFHLAANGTYGTSITVGPQYSSPDPLFDPVYYLRTYASVAASGVDPYQDFLTVGWKLGRNPDAWFNTTYYENQNPDVAAAGVNPLTHFENGGWKEGRDPSLAFSVSGYLNANADVKASGVDPLLEFVQSGQREGRSAVAATPRTGAAADPGVDYAYYYAQHPDVAAQGIDATISYHTVGWRNGWNPSPYFDTNYYLAQNSDVKAAGMDPLSHYEQFGCHEGRTPSMVFSGSAYLAANPDVAAAGMDPLLHYETHGLAEGRGGTLAGQSTAPDPLVNTVYYDTQLGATLFPSGSPGQSEATASFNSYGWQKGLNPDQFFDVNYYLSHNPDVAAAHMNPLLHYENFGWKEGRDPSAQFSTNKYLTAYADVKAAGMDPLVHYVAFGQAEGRTAFHV